MSQDTLTLALISEVFAGPDGGARLAARLAGVRSRGAALAVLPELPLDRWVAATPAARDEDAEDAQGPRWRAQRDAARQAGIGLVGGAIVRTNGVRHNTAFVFDATGAEVGRYAKMHLPDEPGFHEPAHWSPGTEAPRAIQGFSLPLGVQLCSDVNRPEGAHILGARGAMVIVAPRATERATWERWSLVLRASAMTSTCWVVSVNRPAPEEGVPLGGPSLVVEPSGRVLVETTEPVALVTISRAAVLAARTAYPGYLPVRADVYARAWSDIAGSSN